MVLVFSMLSPNSDGMTDSAKNKTTTVCSLTHLSEKPISLQCEACLVSSKSLSYYSAKPVRKACTLCVGV